MISMPNDERILNVLQQTLTEIQRMNTRLAKIETELADVDQHWIITYKS